MKSHAICTVAISLTLMTGCAGIMYETYSRPSVEGIKPTRIRYEDGYLFEYNGVGFYIDIPNRHRIAVVLPLPLPLTESPSKDLTTTDVYVLLRPSKRGGTFNPSHMVWRDSHGQAHHPTHLHRGPNNCETVRLYKRVVIDRQLPMEPISLPANESTCLEVTFPIAPPAPKEPFVIELSGLAFDGEPFPLPPIRFKKSGYVDTVALP